MFKTLEVVEAQRLEVRLLNGGIQARALAGGNSVNVLGTAKVRALSRFDTAAREYHIAVIGTVITGATNWIDIAVAIPNIPLRRLKWFRQVLNDNAGWIALVLWGFDELRNFFKMSALKTTH